MGNKHGFISNIVSMVVEIQVPESTSWRLAELFSSQVLVQGSEEIKWSRVLQHSVKSTEEVLDYSL